MTDLPARIKRLQPLTPAILHILLVLSGGENHGYAVKQEVERRTHGVIKLGPGTLYESIQRMVELSLIEEARRRQSDRTQRRYYRLTSFGRQVLRAEIARLADIVDFARSSLRRAKPA